MFEFIRNTGEYGVLFVILSAIGWGFWQIVVWTGERLKEAGALGAEFIRSVRESIDANTQFVRTAEPLLPEIVNIARQTREQLGEISHVQNAHGEQLDRIIETVMRDRLPAANHPE